MTETRERLHADTTVLARRVFGERAERRAARAALAGCQICVCGYVLSELRATYVYAGALLHQLTTDCEGDVDEALRRLGRYRAARLKQRVIDVYTELRRRGGLREGGQPALDYLEMLIDGGLMDDFVDGVERLHDSIRCTRAQNADRREGSTYRPSTRCQYSDPPSCGIVEYLRDRRAQVAMLRDGPEELDTKVHRGFREVARRVHSDPDRVRGNNCIVVLSDAIIALECPAGARVCTTNMKDFVPICQALGMPRPRDARPASP